MPPHIFFALAVVAAALLVKAVPSEIAWRRSSAAPDLQAAGDTGGDYMWWLKLFASFGVLAMFWAVATVITTVKTWWAGRSQPQQTTTTTANKFVQGPVTYNQTLATSRFQPLAEHAWGAW